MLIEFSVQNFRSFKERVTFSLLPASIREKRNVAPILIEEYKDLAILPSAILYGPNNSGKSNLLTAINALRWMITKSGNFNSDEELKSNEAFYFDEDTRDKPTIFEIDFIAPNKKRYNFTIEFGKNKIYKEHLLRYHNSPKGKTTTQTLYERVEQEIDPKSYLKGTKSFNVNPNQAYLSRGDVEGNEELQEVYAFFSKIKVHQLAEMPYVDFLANNYNAFIQKEDNSAVKMLIDKIINQFDATILSLELGARDLSKIVFSEDLPNEIKESLFEKLKNQTYTIHKLYKEGKETGTAKLPLSKQSTGMRKLLAILPEILPALQNGGTVFLDELNVSLHTEITTFILGLFNNPETNPNNAQLISTTHDMMLLNRELFDRDQIYITDKDKYGVTTLNAFSDYNFGNWRSQNLAQYYESGKLGGLPTLFVPYMHSIIAQYLLNGEEQKQAV